MTFSLSDLYLKRVLTHGKWYIVFGLAFPVVFTIVALIESFNSASLGAPYTFYAFLMPITGLWGMIPMVFYLVSDRRTGFYEHIFATTDLSVRGIYFSLFRDSVLITTIPVALTLALSLAMILTDFSVLPSYFALLLAYSLPVSYITPLLILAVATTWSFTTRIMRGPFTNAPAGFAPLLGVLIVLLPIFVQDHLGSVPVLDIMGTYSLAIAMIFVALVMLSFKIMKAERFLP